MHGTRFAPFLFELIVQLQLEAAVFKARAQVRMATCSHVRTLPHPNIAALKEAGVR